MLIAGACTHTHTPVCEHNDVTVLCSQGARTDRDVTASRPEVHTDRDVTGSRPDIIIKNKKHKTCTPIDVATQRTEMSRRRKQKINKIQQFVYRDTANIEHEMCDYTGNNCSHRSGNKRFKGKFVSHSSKTFNRVTTTDSCTWNVTHNREVLQSET